MTINYGVGEIPESSVDILAVLSDDKLICESRRDILRLARQSDPDSGFEFALGEFIERHSRSERLPALLPIFKKLSGALFWRAIGATWHDFYNTWPHRRAVLGLLRRHSYCSPARMLDHGAPITIYRGCSR